MLSSQESEMGSKGTNHHGKELWPELQGQALGGWGGVRPGRGARHLAKGFMGII